MKVQTKMHGFVFAETHHPEMDFTLVITKEMKLSQERAQIGVDYMFVVNVEE